ncbi:MAG: hypothetical protein RBT25_11585, partial [Lentisphaeria bacterium]|nr:hypothetical protein [Lentisphaeria bacterium]
MHQQREFLQGDLFTLCPHTQRFRNWCDHRDRFEGDTGKAFPDFHMGQPAPQQSSQSARPPAKDGQV